MTVGEMVCGAFSFNADFRIICYLDETDEEIVMYDSRVSGDIPFDLLRQEISAVNEGDDHILEIEYWSDE